MPDELFNAREMAELLFPDVTKTPEDMEKLYPARQLPEGAKVTRFAPSPTGFVHFGGLFPAMAGERLAHQSGGVFYLRIEDTDAKREVEGAAEGLINTLAYYGIHFDEGVTADGEKGAYGPYRQSDRAEIYHVYAKKLVQEGKAYPCFCSKEEQEELDRQDKKELLREKDWHEADAERLAQQAQWRSITLEEARAHVKAGDPYVLRLLAGGDPEKKIRVTDLVRGNLEIPENDEDIVLLKNDGIPTYHFAHAVDDHLMGTTHVIRGEEWLPSLAKHLMLFSSLGFRAPKYMHIAQLMRLDENGGRKKLSKRDMGANMEDYRRLGYAPECVREYVMTLLNSNYEEWRAANPDRDYRDFPFSPKKMSVSGCLFDMDKLNDVSKNTIARMSAAQVAGEVRAWAADFDPAFSALLEADPEKTEQIFAIGRGGKKPRKDLACWGGAKEYMGFFFAPLMNRNLTFDERFPKEKIREILNSYRQSYTLETDNSGWFNHVKELAEQFGFCSNMKAYKADPDAYPGHVGDISGFIRMAVTGQTNSPDLFTVMTILGKDECDRRLEEAAAALA